MNIIVVLGIALALAMDAFAVAVGVSLSMRGCTPRQTIRLSLYFGLFQFAMPILGWAAGRTVAGTIQAFDHWIAAGLLVFIGGKMMVEALKKDKAGIEPGASCPDQTRGRRVLVLSLATSLDALAVGLGLAALGVPVVYPALVIGVVAFVVTAVGTRLGPILGRWAGKWAEIAGGLVLLGIAAKILVDHLG
ncbi:MAG: manganese efflux pump MntP family protein [Candidatus Aminicenantes bacterium]|nr:manganese efflux pump MntP family protein [Candidatus Aminicenantes bacterium]